MFGRGQFPLLFIRGTGERMIQIMPVACRLETPLPRLKVKLKDDVASDYHEYWPAGQGRDPILLCCLCTLWVHSSVQLARLLSCPPNIIEVKRATVPRYVRNNQFHLRS